MTWRRFPFHLVWLLLAAAMVLCVAWPPVAEAAEKSKDPAPVQALKSQYGALVAQHKLQIKRQRQLLARQGALADEIEKLQESEPGILARLRLERLLAENLELSNELTEVAQALTTNENTRVTKREEIYGAYSVAMEAVARRMRQAGDRKQAARIAHRFYELRQLRWKWRGATTIEADFSRLVVTESELDGPTELLAKADILTDLVGKIRGAIREIDRRIRRLTREQKLGEDFDAMVKEMNLFEEGARFVRRPEDSGRTDDDPPGPSTESDDAGLHLPPLDSTQDAAPGSDRAGRSIQSEIKRLEDEKKVLLKLAFDLSVKANELRRKAEKLRQLEQKGRQ